MTVLRNITKLILKTVLIYFLHYVGKGAKTFEMDFKGLGQKYFPQEWQRELMALTALSQLEGLDLLSLETRNETRAWKRFRANGISEALVNMVRLGGFQMYNETDRFSLGALSMWGLSDSIPAFYDEPRYEDYKEAAQGLSFIDRKWARALNVRAAFVMAAKWAVDLKGKVAFYDKPFYGVEETVAALIRLRDPTSFFQGNQSEGESLLRRKLIFGGQPTCQREARIAIAFDAHYYNRYDMPKINTVFDDLRRFNPRADITIRGTSLLKGGFKEGYKMQEIPSLEADPFAKPFDILDLVEKSIGDIRFSELASENLRARVLIIISKLKDRKINVKRAEGLWSTMRALSVEPFYFTVESADVQYNDGDLLPLLNNQTYRGISSGTDNAETMKMIVHRLVRLICQAPVVVPYGKWKLLKTYEPTYNSIYSRIHLRYERPPGPGMTRFISFACVSYPSCDFSFYASTSRYLNEYLCDGAHPNRTIKHEQMIWEDPFAMSGNPIAMNLVLIPKTRSVMGVQMIHSPNLITA